MASTGRDKDLLGVLIRQREAGCRLKLSHPEPAIPQIEVRIVQDDAAVRIGVIDTEIVILARGGVVGTIPDLERDIADGVKGDLIQLQDLDDWPALVLKIERSLIAGLQADGLYPFFFKLGDVVGVRHGDLLDLEAARLHITGDGAVGSGNPFILEIAVDPLNGEYRSRDRSVCTNLRFRQGEIRLFEIFKNQLLLVTRPQPDGLCGRVADHIRLRHGDFRHLIAVNRQRESDRPVLPGGHIIVVAKVDAADFKGGVGNRLPVLLIPLQNGELGEVCIGGRHRDRAAAIHHGLVHIDQHRLLEFGLAGRCGDLHKRKKAFGHIGDRDGACGSGLVRGDQLAVFKDVEDSVGEGIPGVVQLQQLDLDFGIVFKDQGDLIFPVPIEFLLDFVGIRT